MDTETSVIPDPMKVIDFSGNTIHMLQEGKGELWFKAADICHVMELQNTSQAVRQHVLAGEARKIRVLTETRGWQEQTFVNELGLYELVCGSTKPEAIRFRAWVFGDVLRSIRETGEYNHEAYLARVRLEQENAELKETSHILYKQVETFNNIATATIYDYGRELSEREISVMAEYIRVGEELKETNSELRRSRNTVILQRKALDDYVVLAKKYLKQGDSEELKLLFRAAVDKHKMTNDSLTGYIFLDEDGLVRFDYDALEALRKSYVPVKPVRLRDTEYIFARFKQMEAEIKELAAKANKEKKNG